MGCNLVFEGFLMKAVVPQSKFKRLMVLLSVTWILLACWLYFPHIGQPDHTSPSWISTWYSIVPIEAAVLTYDRECFEAIKLSELYCNNSFSPLGFALFLMLPLLILWFLGLGIAWVLDADKKPTGDPKSDS